MSKNVLYFPTDLQQAVKQNKEIIKYQVRFVKPNATLKKNDVIVIDPKEIKKWRQYYKDQETLAQIPDSGLSLIDRQRILDCIKEFAPTGERTLLIKELLE